MPRLAKGAKWTYGWVVVGPAGSITIPPDAWHEFGFREGDDAIFLPGSRRSGGFALSTPALMARMSQRLGGGTLHVLAISRLGDGQVSLPSEIRVEPSTSLLTVRGSGHGLGFVAQGPIYQEALRQSHRLEVFG